MKNKKIILSILFLSFIGCNSDSDISEKNGRTDDIIRFSDTISGVTKAMIDDTSLPDGYAVGVYSWGHHKNDGDVNTTLRTDLTNAKYTKQTGKDELIASINAHYPVNPDTLLNIYAYYPYRETIDDPAVIPFDLREQDDLMWADPIENRNKTSASPTVNLQFNHILSAITITIKKADDIKEQMVLESISLKEYAQTVQLNIQTGELTQPVTSIPMEIVGGLNQTMTPEVYTITTNYMLCPIDKPVFIIRMSGADYTVPATKAFLPGKKQTYDFTIQASDIVVNGQIKPWEDGGSSNETVYF